MKTQYEGEMMKLEEECSYKLSNVSKEMNSKDQKIALYEQDVQLARKHLREVRYGIPIDNSNTLLTLTIVLFICDNMS